MKSFVISGFPGTGKSYLFKEISKYAADSDSSKFDKSKFPENYMKHIKSLLGEKRFIFVSSHQEVRDALVENGIEFILVYPKRELKEEYIERYKERGSPKGFIKLLTEKWDEWMDGLEKQKGCDHRVLGEGQFIRDLIRIREKDELS